MSLEVCVDSVESALNAFKGGAKRLELCSTLSLGGLTPSLGFFHVVRRSLPKECDIFVMIRPKPGESYVYDNYEIEVMVEDIKIFKQNGANGFVFGCLDACRQIDEKSCMKLLKAAEGLPSTFHRAFDIVQNPEDSLMTLINLGFCRILTSGQEKNAFLGRHFIKKLALKVEKSGFDLRIVAGGGICVENLEEVIETTKLREYHSSGRAKSISASEQPSGVYVTDSSVVREMVQIIENLDKLAKE